MRLIQIENRWGKTGAVDSEGAAERIVGAKEFFAINCDFVKQRPQQSLSRREKSGAVRRMRVKSPDGKAAAQEVVEIKTDDINVFRKQLHL
jgi:hypothetical protein